MVTTVTNDLPAQETTSVYEMPHLMGLHLADPSFHVPGRIDVLLGADIYPQIMVKLKTTKKCYAVGFDSNGFIMGIRASNFCPTEDLISWLQGKGVVS